MQKLNHYLDELAQDLVPEPVSLNFWIKQDGSLKEIKTKLRSDGQLSSLYYALDLITKEEYIQWTGG